MRAAEGLSGRAMADYLIAKGWNARQSRVKDFLIFTWPTGSDPEGILLVLPVASGIDEEHLRVADALRTVGAVEGRDVFAVANDALRLQPSAPPVFAAGFAEGD
jgi:hypothetical protein